MLKKRLIFTLLYDSGFFMLSRNFRLQRVGDLDWLRSNYNFAKTSYSIDELVVLDVTRDKKDINIFSKTLKELTKGIFVPISAGGGIENIESARQLLRSGADKIVLNSILYRNDEVVKDLAQEFGKQCIIASVDVQVDVNKEYVAMSRNGQVREAGSAHSWIKKIASQNVGEIYLNSIDRDGTGQGFDLGLLEILPSESSLPTIIAGGAGNSEHLQIGLLDRRVDAVATANLFNFIGNGLRNTRRDLVENGIVLPMWDLAEIVIPLQTKVQIGRYLD